MFGQVVTVREFVRDFSEGVSSTSPLQALLIICAILFSLWAYRRYTTRLQRQANEERQRKSELKFERWCKKYQLSPSERKLMLELVDHLLEPDYHKHWLFEKEAYFNRAFTRTLKDEPHLASRLMALKVRLGFTEKSEGKIIRTTAEMPVGTELYLRESDDHPPELLFKVLEVHPGHVEVGLLASRRPKEQILKLYFIRPEGVYTLRGMIMPVQDGRLLLRHTELLFRKQTRAYFRHTVQLPFELAGAAAQTIDLGGGGCSLQLLEGDIELFVVGEAYDFALDFSETRRIFGAARVVGIRGSIDRTIHLQFTTIREPDRDLIINHLFDRHREEVV